MFLERVINIENKKYWVWLTLIKINVRKKLELLEKYKTPEVIYNLSKSKLSNNNLNDKDIEKILNKEIRIDLKKHLEYMKLNNIKIINIFDENYPKILKQIYDPPISLYVIGNDKILNENNIAIIGCRECTKYGEKQAKVFSYKLAKENINIVSGLAKGVDSYAHIGTLYANGKTIAVLGNGLDTIYPKENVDLAKQIIKNKGCIVSEYPLGTKPEKQNFPQRNRIISGISKGVLVIEAKEQSGTLITVDFALEQGRDVFVLPGNIDSISSTGTNRLIQEGAKLVTTYEEILK